MISDVAERPGFVRGLLQGSGRDWHTNNLFDGGDIKASIDASVAREKALYSALTASSSIFVPPQVQRFSIDRKGHLDRVGRSVVVTAHVYESEDLKATKGLNEPHTLLRLAYLLLNLSYNDISCPWFYEQSHALETLVKALSMLSKYSLYSDPFLANNSNLRLERAKFTMLSVGPVIPVLLVLVDNLATFVVQNADFADAHVLQLWKDVIWPNISETLAATVTKWDGSIFLYCLLGECLNDSPIEKLGDVKPEPMYSAINEKLWKDIVLAIQQMRRRSGVLGESNQNVFLAKADSCYLAFDLLYNVICMSSCDDDLRISALTDLITVCDDILTRKSNKDAYGLGTLEFIQAGRYGSLFRIFLVRGFSFLSYS